MDIYWYVFPFCLNLTLTFIALQAVGKLYKEDAKLIWNGNAASGMEQINKLLESLPPSEHIIEGMDTQPLLLGMLCALHFLLYTCDRLLQIADIHHFLSVHLSSANHMLNQPLAEKRIHSGIDESLQKREMYYFISILH